MALTYNDVNKFLTGTGVGRTLDTITDFIPLLGTAKNLGLGAWSLADGEGGNTDYGRLIGGGLGLASPLLAKGIGSALTKKGAKIAAKAGTKAATVANKAAAKSLGVTVAELTEAGLGQAVATGATKTSQALTKAGQYLGNTGGALVAGQRAIPAGIATMAGKSGTKSVQTDLANEAEANNILNSDLMTGNYYNTLLEKLNQQSANEASIYAQDLAKQRLQDETQAGYSAMNAGNVGLTNLLQGNIGNTYNQLSLQAQNALQQQQQSNALSAMSQEQNSLQNMLAYAQSTGNTKLVEAIMKKMASATPVLP